VKVKTFFYEFFCLAPQAQPSPTTGKFSFFPNGSSKNSTAGSKLPDNSKETFFEDINSSSFAFKPMGESGSSFFLGGTSKVITLGSLAF
jgi:WRKY transcription factor 2